MKRSKKIVILSHCILNANSKIYGVCQYQGNIKSVISKYLEENVGIIQLPCPELTYLGLNRWGMTKEQYNNPGYIRHCRKLLEPILDQIKMYLSDGYNILEVVGIDGSPTCGANFSCGGYTGGDISLAPNQEEYIIEEKGVFIEEFQKMLKEEDIELKFTGINEKEIFGED